MLAVSEVEFCDKRHRKAGKKVMAKYVGELAGG